MMRACKESDYYGNRCSPTPPICLGIAILYVEIVCFIVKSYVE